MIVETGKVLKVEGDGYSEFLNIEDKVLYKDGGEEGFFDIAFHPSGEYLLISYSNLNNALEVDKYLIRDDKVIFDSVLFFLDGSNAAFLQLRRIWLSCSTAA